MNFPGDCDVPSLRFRLVAEKKHSLLSRRHRTHGGSWGASTGPRSQRTFRRRQGSCSMSDNDHWLTGGGVELHIRKLGRYGCVIDWAVSGYRLSTADGFRYDVERLKETPSRICLNNAETCIEGWSRLFAESSMPRPLSPATHDSIHVSTSYKPLSPLHTMLTPCPPHPSSFTIFAASSPRPPSTYAKPSPFTNSAP